MNNSYKVKYIPRVLSMSMYPNDIHPLIKPLKYKILRFYTLPKIQ